MEDYVFFLTQNFSIVSYNEEIHILLLKRNCIKENKFQNFQFWICWHLFFILGHKGCQAFWFLMVKISIIIMIIMVIIVIMIVIKTEISLEIIIIKLILIAKITIKIIKITMIILRKNSFSNQFFNKNPSFKFCNHSH